VTSSHFVDTSAIVRRVRAEYWEVPGLRLTLPQAQRFWALDAATCQVVLRILLDERFLALRSDGSYARADSH
jgi:hypothetical protein